MLLNNIDYVLADAGVDLDEAHTTQVSILAKAEAETADWSLDTAIPIVMSKEGDLMSKEGDLAAAWDTLGWILYKQGKLEDAFSYCLAARYIGDDPSVRDHLTAIATAMRKPSAVAIARKDDQEFRTIRLAPSAGRHGVDSVKKAPDRPTARSSTPRPHSPPPPTPHLELP